MATNLFSPSNSVASSRYACTVCGWIYDPSIGDPLSSPPIEKGVPFEQLPTTWNCPICGADKSQFKPLKTV